MINPTSVPDRRPPQVTAAFWLQLAVVGLLGVLASVNTVGAVLFRQMFSDGPPGYPLFCGLLFCLAGWLAVAAFGLRRRSRAAYGSSLAGLVLPLLLAAAVVLGAGATSDQSFGYFTTGPDAFELVEFFQMWTTLSTVLNGVGAVVGPLLALLTAGMLVSGAGRRFFA